MNTSFSYAFLSLLGLGLIFCSCSDSKLNDYSAYFGGEVINPKDKWIYFYKGDQLLDSVAIDQNNRFFIQFDSLPVGLYSFKHEAEYQYAYFDKNDSLMIRVNTNNFDESLVFCGKGDEKNNFLIEMYLNNQKDRNSMFPTFDLDEENFIKKADSSYQEALKFYTSNKNNIQWNENFDIIAKASADYPYYTKKEFYPVAHKGRAINDTIQNLSSNFYNHRNFVNFNNDQLIDFWPYIQYINTTVDNIANTENKGFLSDSKTTLKKIEIIDSLTKNESIKNKIVNNIAFRYLIIKEENATDTLFLEKYYQVSTDIEKKDKIKELARSIQNLSETGLLPNITLKSPENTDISSNEIFERKTILYFWTRKNESHFFAVHKKLQKIIEKHPSIDIVAVNLDENHEEWKSFSEKNKHIPNSKIRHYQISNLEEVKNKWAVTKETRALIIDKQGKIIKGFVNLFETTFDKQL